MTELADVLTSRLRQLRGPAVEVTGLRQLPGGASRESWDVRVRAMPAQAKTIRRAARTSA